MGRAAAWLVVLAACGCATGEKVLPERQVYHLTEPVGPFSGAVVVGDTLYASGQIGTRQHRDDPALAFGRRPPVRVPAGVLERDLGRLPRARHVDHDGLPHGERPLVLLSGQMGHRLLQHDREDRVDGHVVPVAVGSTGKEQYAAAAQALLQEEGLSFPGQ